MMVWLRVRMVRSHELYRGGWQGRGVLGWHREWELRERTSDRGERVERRTRSGSGVAANDQGVLLV